MRLSKRLSELPATIVSAMKYTQSRNLNRFLLLKNITNNTLLLTFHMFINFGNNWTILQFSPFGMILSSMAVMNMLLYQIDIDNFHLIFGTLANESSKNQLKMHNFYILTSFNDFLSILFRDEDNSNRYRHTHLMIEF